MANFTALPIFTLQNNIILNLDFRLFVGATQLVRSTPQKVSFRICYVTETFTSYLALTRLSTLLGLRAYPPLDVIISKAASPEIPIRRYALQFLLTYMDTLYPNYNPLEFADVAFLPCGRTMQPSMGTPEQVTFCHHPVSDPLIRCHKVFISADWEPLGFKKLHHTITEKDAVRLKIKERPSASAIIDVLKKTPPKNKKEAVSWFELLASKGGESLLIDPVNCIQLPFRL